MNPFLKELIWLTGAAVLTIIIIFPVYHTLPYRSIDIHIHDTYFVIAGGMSVAPFFILIVFLIYLFKESRYLFSRDFPNFILISSGMIFWILLAVLARLFTRFSIVDNTGWTSYPPGITPPQAERNTAAGTDPYWNTLSNIFIVLQAAVIFCLLMVAYRWGRKKRKGGKEIPFNIEA